MPDRLQEIRARLDAATPGPWRTEGPCMSGDGTYGVWSEADPGEPTIAYRMAEADADFIAHSRDDVAWLMREVGAARREIRDEIARLTKTKTHAINAGQFELAAEINDSIRALGRSFFGRSLRA